MSLDQAREYLAKVVPWPENGEAFVNIHWTSQRPGFNKPLWGGRACCDVGEAARTIEWVKQQADTRDIYVCMSSQREARDRVSRGGYKYRDAIRSQPNAVALKSLFIDLDAKGTDKNSYATIDDAGAALAKFIQDASLPRPNIMVASGGGLHVYWTLVRALTIDEWRPLAFALAEATKRHGLKCDTQCTVDAARVLRVPDTFNRKTEPARAVVLAGARLDYDYTVERIEKALEPFKVAVPILAQASPLLDPALFPKRAPLQSDELSAGIEQHAAVRLDDVAVSCAFIRDTLATGGLANGQPLWNLTTLLATFTDNPRPDAHRMSCGHPEYDKDKTDAFFDRKDREQKEKGLGWPSCATISAAGATQCQTCPHFTKGKAPPHFVTKREAPPQSSPATSSPAQSFGALLGPVLANSTQAGSGSLLPSGYTRNAAGVIVVDVVDDQGTTTQVPISDYEMTDALLQTSPSILHFTTTIAGKSERMHLPTEAISTQDMRRILQDQGFMLPPGPKAQDTLARFFVSWIKHLQDTKNTVSSEPFGWHVKNGKLQGFIYGGNCWTPTGPTLAASPDTVTARHYEPTGDEQPWIDACKMITDQGRPELEAIVAAAFAAPLVRFTGQAGVIMSAYSKQSGVGKTTSLNIAQAVWGSYEKAVQSLDDTQNSVMRKLGEIRSLPLFWDELKTEEDTKKFVKITFQVTQGKEKSRLTRSAKQLEPGSWQTLLLSASNDSLLDFVVGQTNMTTAGLYRVFEYHVDQAPPGSVGRIDPSDAQLKVAKLKDNYGNVGLRYAKFLGANHAAVEKEVSDFTREIGRETKSVADERFWIALISSVLMGARYANHIGVAQFNEEKLKAFMLDVLAKMRLVRTEQPVDMDVAANVSNIFAQFLNAMRARHMLLTNKIHVSAGKPPPGSIRVIGDASRIDGVYVHVGMEDKIIRISSLALSEWLKSKGYSRHVFTKALANEFGTKRVYGHIGGGTQFAVSKEYMFEIDLAGSPLLDFIDQV